LGRCPHTNPNWRPELLVCEEYTPWEDVLTLILRWSNAHEHGGGKRLYVLAHADALSISTQLLAATAIRDASLKAVSPFAIITAGLEGSHLASQYGNHRVTLPILPSELLQEVHAQLPRPGRSLSLYCGSHAGSGKSFQVRSRAKREAIEIISLPVNRNLSTGEFITALKAAISRSTSQVYLLHIDIASPVGSCFSRLLVDLILLGGLTDARTGEAFFLNPEDVSIAVEIAAGSNTKIPFTKLLPFCRMEAPEDAFKGDQKSLEQGMSHGEFYSWRYDGSYDATIKDQSAYTAFERLQYVAAALDIQGKGAGFPFKFEPAKLNKVISGPKCFELISNACPSLVTGGGGISMWCLWSFVNVLHYEMQEMHHPESPVNAACMPDIKAKDPDDDVELKEKIKSELTAFLIKTAAEFTTRHSEAKTEQNLLKGVRLDGFHETKFEGLWRLCEYQNDGEAVFEKRSKRESFFLYYRGCSDQWVIDTIITPSGAVFARNESRGKELQGSWVMRGDWVIDPKVEVKRKRVPQGHNGDAIEITGGKVGLDLDGVYLRQPEYDDIHGEPHYIKHGEEGENEQRRHLFRASPPQVDWQISPVCNDDEGCFAISQGSDIDGDWTVEADDVREEGHTLELIWEGQEDRGRKGVKEVNIEEKEEGLDPLKDMIKWNDSNHECLIFSNRNHVVHFMSLDSKLMRVRMHPMLLRFLEGNGIVVGEQLEEKPETIIQALNRGESLASLNEKHYGILSALTNIYRSQEDAQGLLGGSYCLTGDTLLKMLAIYLRIKCGIPAVLMGECGCGKTELVKYLCAWLGVKLLVLNVHGGTTEEDVRAIFQDALEALDDKAASVYVFLDEINTCPYMGLMCEAICHRSLEA